LNCIQVGIFLFKIQNFEGFIARPDVCMRV